MSRPAPPHAPAAHARPGDAAAAVAGVAAAAVGAGTGEVLAALFAPRASPVAAVGSALIDLAPAWAKDLAIAAFGTSDKIALLAGIAVVLAAAAAGAGALQARRPPWGAALLAALGLLGAAAVATRADASALSALPALAAGATAAAVLVVLVRRAPGRGPAAPRRAPGPHALSRRSFLAVAAVAALAGAGAVAWAATRSAGRRTVAAVRAGLRLPPARVPATIPSDADLGIEGLAPVRTPNADFYRIDTALVVPEIDPADWSLRIHGLVERELVVSWDELLSLPLEEHVVTLACVSNEVGGDLVGTAVWRGLPVRDLLARAGPLPGADMVLSTSHDGFTAGTPLEALTDDRAALLAVGMNGEPLPVEHGFPVRMVVPGLYGYVSATKWVVDLEVTRYDRARAYWTDRGWSERGPIKLQSRIDVPRGSQVAAGAVTIAGVAWHPHVGVTGVEVQVDDGPWRPAQLARAVSADTWVQWAVRAELEAGPHEVRCRARGADGDTQTPDTAPPAPDGATGWHTRRIVAA